MRRSACCGTFDKDEEKNLYGKKCMLYVSAFFEKKVLPCHCTLSGALDPRLMPSPSLALAARLP